MTNYITAVVCAGIAGLTLKNQFIIACIFIGFSVSFLLIQIFDRGKVPTHEEIAALAAHKWEQAGRPEGRDEEFWLEAERELR